jgi:hypothetical protein
VSDLSFRKFRSGNNERSRPATGRLPSLGRIVPTEAKPSELSGEILWAHQRGVKAKSGNNVNVFISIIYKIVAAQITRI